MFIYLRTRTSWRQQPVLNDPVSGDNGYADNFGGLVAAAGSNVMTAAFSAGSKDTSGLVYAYAPSGRTWRRVATLINPLGADSSRHHFGVSLAMSGSIAMIGDTGSNSYGSGTVYVYRRTKTGWLPQGRITEPPRADGLFGSSVAVSGTTAVIGDIGTRNGAGSAYLYTRSGAAWHERAVLADPAHAKDDNFGWSVSVSDGTVAVGAPFAENSAGLAYVYAPDGQSWSLQRRLVSPHPEHLAEFGRDLAISGPRVLVGVPVQRGSRRCGTAYLYEKLAKSWRLRAEIVDPVCVYDDHFGFAVALQGRTAVIGAPLKYQANGAVYVVTVP